MLGADRTKIPPRSIGKFYCKVAIKCHLSGFLHRNPLYGHNFWCYCTGSPKKHVHGVQIQNTNEPLNVAQF